MADAEVAPFLRRTDAQWRAAVVAALDEIQGGGFTIRQWELRDLFIEGILPDVFIKNCKQLVNFANTPALRQIFTEGVLARVIESSTDMRIVEFFNFTEWLKTKAGQEAVQRVMLREKNSKRTLPGFSVEETSYTNLLAIQLGDYGVAVKKSRTGFDERISELRRQIAEQEALKAQSLAALEAAFRPASRFVEPTTTIIRREALRMYEEAAQAANNRQVLTGVEAIEASTKEYGQRVRERAMAEFCRAQDVKEGLQRFAVDGIQKASASFQHKEVRRFATSWLQRVLKILLSYPLKLRMNMLAMIPMGKLSRSTRHSLTSPLKMYLKDERLLLKAVLGEKVKPGLSRKIELRVDAVAEQLVNVRVQVFRTWAPERVRAIPVARSKFEAGVRRVIGGGEMRGWDVDGKMYRGGGNLKDAMMFLYQARCDVPGKFLSEVFSVGGARELLGLCAGMRVPDGPASCVMKNFNDDATAGPFLRAFGIKSKFGFKRKLEEVMWRFYDRCGDGEGDDLGLPFLSARVGFRSKLVTEVEARKRLEKNKTMGRAVMMLDALEQVASSPLYNVISHYTNSNKLDENSGFKNSLIRASAEWGSLWQQVKEAAVVVELDWKKFDRERPREDVEFIIDVVLSCFQPSSPREERLLKAYGVMMRRALVERVVVTDNGGVFMIDGMVPSGSLWTGWLDTALNILYVQSACLHLGLSRDICRAKCAGDDNLTLFDVDVSDERLLKIRDLLNSWFRAGIEEEDFLIHRPPFHVTKEQACFDAGIDLSKGTSGLLDKARWVEFEGEVMVDNAAGRSHRWRYRFSGKPKFLSCYWLEDGRPIRPARDNLEKLLYPEGIHENIEVYEGALASMVVDNPHNHHNVNHLLSRYIIVQQIKRQCFGCIPHGLCMKLSAIRPEVEEDVPFPQVAAWRRSKEHGRLEDYVDLQDYVQEFKSFLTGVTSLYSRSPSGGLDSWQFMEIVRGESVVGSGQFGNDLIAWIMWLRSQPMTRYLKAAKSKRLPSQFAECTSQAEHNFDRAMNAMFDKVESGALRSSIDFGLWISDLYKTLR
ncbi:TPA_asm: fusion protein [Amaranthus tuberculatus amalgavirus 1]|nr:TPA_asm: fusion protein [Amaranthus tuberculatus amalgavirus 1]